MVKQLGYHPKGTSIFLMSIGKYTENMDPVKGIFGEQGTSTSVPPRIITFFACTGRLVEISESNISVCV